MKSESRLSTRISLRWPPAPPFENTDTIVLSVKDWYVDLRVDRSNPRTPSVDWAIAGQRLIESREPHRVLFTHELDSRDSFEETDCGTFTTLPNGDDLEKGTMPRPDVPGNPLAKYEEVWRTLKFPEGPEGRMQGISWILESESSVSHTDTHAQNGNGNGTQGKERVQVTKTFLGRIWGVYVALRQQQGYTRYKNKDGKWVISDRTGGDVSVRREEWVRSRLISTSYHNSSSPSSSSSSSLSQPSGWRERYVLGPDAGNLPSLIAGLEGEGQGPWRVRGEKVMVGGERYIVRAFEAVE